LIELVDKSIAESEAKSTFVANVSHEIRTLINVIHGMAKIVYDSCENEEEKENLSVIRDSSSFLLSLVNDLLDLSKIESGKSELKEEYLNLPQKIKQITAIFRKQAKDKGLELNYRIDKNVPRTVVSDSGKLQQVLINLIDNAIKFTEKGEINIALELVQDRDLEKQLPDFNEENKAVVLFSISDTGIGIPESKLEYIFEDISKYNSYHQKSCRKGTGLGLPLTKSLVELMGGAVGVRSTEGSGSTFYFTIPFTIPPNEADNPGKLVEFNSIQKLDQSALQKANGLNILLVEDRLMTQKLMTLMLEKKGHQVTVALNGNVAIKLLEEKSFDIILMDLYMPEMDGYETTAYIRNIEKGVKRTAIIAMTASATTDVRDSCLKAGMDGFISKPVTAQEIDRVIDEVMRDKSWNL
jgi:CheY-like chemotaxis protein/nitrogen-specific signal transduction histidine kinase